MSATALVECQFTNEFSPAMIRLGKVIVEITSRQSGYVMIENELP